MRPPFAKYWDERAKHCSGCWYDMTGVEGTVCPECGRDMTRHESWFTDGRWRMWPLIGIAAAIALVLPPVTVLTIGWMVARHQSGSATTPAIVGFFATKLFGLATAGVFYLLALRYSRHLWSAFFRGLTVLLTIYLVGLASAELSKWLLLPEVGP